MMELYEMPKNKKTGKIHCPKCLRELKSKDLVLYCKKCKMYYLFGGQRTVNEHKFSDEGIEKITQHITRYVFKIYWGLLSFSTLTFFFGLWLGSGEDIFLLLGIPPLIIMVILLYQKIKMERDVKEE